MALLRGLDRWTRDAGLLHAVLDGHGLLHARPRPRYGVHAPICSRNGVAFFGRDSDATLPVWSARDGYPGHPSYREFHRDLGRSAVGGAETARVGPTKALGLKLHAVTDHGALLDAKKPYEPERAAEQVRRHAGHYLEGRRLQLTQLNNVMDAEPLLVAPFDAELFGHWWFEGPAFSPNCSAKDRNKVLRSPGCGMS